MSARIAFSIILATVLCSSVFFTGCGCDDESTGVEADLHEMPGIAGDVTIEESGGSRDVGYMVARTEDGDRMDIVSTAMESRPSEDDLIMFVIISATGDARASGDEASFEMVEASRATQPADPTIVFLTESEAGNKVYAGWYCESDQSLVIASMSGDNMSFASGIECDDSATGEQTVAASTEAASPPSTSMAPATTSPSTQVTPEYSPVPTITATPLPAQDSSSQTGEITDDFAEVVGDFPQLLSDNDDSTYVRGGIVPGDWVATFRLSVEETPQLTFLARVKCVSAGCGGSEVCGFVFMVKNQTTGMFEKFDGAPWEEPGIHEYQLVMEDSSDYIADGLAEFKFRFECNMDGYVTEFRKL